MFPSICFFLLTDETSVHIRNKGGYTRGAPVGHARRIPQASGVPPKVVEHLCCAV